MPSIIEVQTALQKLTNKKITYTEMGKVWGTKRASVSVGEAKYELMCNL